MSKNFINIQKMIIFANEKRYGKRNYYNKRV